MKRDSDGSRQAVVEHGDPVLIITRRLFSSDARRHFAGHVERYDGTALRVAGYVYVQSPDGKHFIKRKGQRTRVFALDNHIMLYVLPSDTEVGAIHYDRTDEHGLIATDGKHFRIELDDFAPA